MKLSTLAILTVAAFVASYAAVWAWVNFFPPLPVHF